MKSRALDYAALVVKYVDITVHEQSIGGRTRRITPTKITG
jgi:hypothetical protein